MKVPNWQAWLSNKQECKLHLDKYVQKKVLRKNTLTPEIYLKKAVHNLDFGNWVNEKNKNELLNLFNEQFYDWSIAAYYYSVYHSALALITKKGYESKSHAATLCAVIWFYYHEASHLEKRDIEVIKDSINKDDVEKISKTKSLRERASYDASAVFGQAITDKAKADAAYLLEKVRRIIE